MSELRMMNYPSVVGERYPDDIDRMQRVLIANGCLAARADLEALWGDYSDSFAAGWLFLPESDDELLGILMGKLVDG
jgi:hypothetical protein